MVDHISMQQLFGWLWSDFDKIKELHFQQNMSVLSPFIGRSQLIASDGVGNIISPDSPSLVSIGLHSERPSLVAKSSSLNYKWLINPWNQMGFVLTPTKRIESIFQVNQFLSKALAFASLWLTLQQESNLSIWIHDV